MLMTTEKKDTINITGKTIIVIGLLLLLLAGTFGMFFLRSSPNNFEFVSAQPKSASGNMPEKCELPAGTEENSWKEHLGHHAETQDCLKYFR